MFSVVLHCITVSVWCNQMRMSDTSDQWFDYSRILNGIVNRLRNVILRNNLVRCVLCTQLHTHWYLISTVIKMKLSSLVTYIFEIYSSRPFQRGITWAKKFANSWDSDSQLLEVIIKMSPDGANFLAKVFIEVRKVSMQKLTLETKIAISRNQIF